jgi:oligosaccharyltransferase complex subunit epsilon
MASLNQQPISLAHLSTATQDVWKSYRANTPNSLLIIDAFLVFLMYVGAVQFVYACLTGGYPFNSFLAGFSAAVGQFVLAGISPFL